METIPVDILQVLISEYLEDVRPMLLASKTMFVNTVKATARLTIIPRLAHYNPAYFPNAIELTLQNLHKFDTIRSARFLAHHNPRLTKLTVVDEVYKSELVATAMIAVALPNLLIDCEYRESGKSAFCSSFDWSQHCRIYASEYFPDGGIHDRVSSVVLPSNAKIEGVYPNVTNLTTFGVLRSGGYNFPNVVSLTTAKIRNSLQFTNITSLNCRGSGFSSITSALQLASLTNLRSLVWPVMSSSIPTTLTNLTRIRLLDCDSDCSKLPIQDVYLTDCTHDFLVPSTLTRLEVYTAEIFLDWVRLPSICNLRELIMDIPSDPTTVINIGNLFSTVPTLKSISVGISTFTRQGLVGRDINEDLGFLPQ